MKLTFAKVAQRLARALALQGYWASIYDQRTGECLEEHAPHDHNPPKGNSHETQTL